MSKAVGLTQHIDSLPEPISHKTEGKPTNVEPEEQQPNISFILLTFFIFHFEISGKDDNFEQQ